jgi:hypothetical protein
MTQKSMLEKVRVRRPRPPEPTPKEREAWQAFIKMAEELQGEGKELNPLVAAELGRLAAKGNPLAIRLKERLSAAAFKPREATNSPKHRPFPDAYRL